MDANGRLILDFKDGEVVAILPIADSDEQAKALLQQLKRAAVCGDLSGLKDNEPR
jgi:hypothetical protein